MGCAASSPPAEPAAAAGHAAPAAAGAGAGSQQPIDQERALELMHHLLPASRAAGSPEERPKGGDEVPQTHELYLQKDRKGNTCAARAAPPRGAVRAGRSARRDGGRRGRRRFVNQYVIIRDLGRGSYGTVPTDAHLFLSHFSTKTLAILAAASSLPYAPGRGPRR